MEKNPKHPEHFKIIRRPKLRSTNLRLREMALEGAPEFTVVTAGCQSAGMGRLGRTWISPKGGLWFSLLLRPQIPVEEAPKLNLLAAVAVARTINALYGIDARVKWPNDVQVSGKKLCGILSEMRSNGHLEQVIIGIGLNADFHLRELPPDIRERSATILDQLGRKIDTGVLLDRILDEFWTRYLAFCGGDRLGVITEWKSLTDTLGRKVKIETLAGYVEGTAIDLDEGGGLILKMNAGTVRVTTGDCFHIG